MLSTGNTKAPFRICNTLLIYRLFFYGTYPNDPQLSLKAHFLHILSSSIPYNYLTFLWPQIMLVSLFWFKSKFTSYWSKQGRSTISLSSCFGMRRIKSASVMSWFRLIFSVASYNSWIFIIFIYYFHFRLLLQFYWKTGPVKVSKSILE